ncbi:MAG: hypothetical protein M1269_12410 [Chloroflexi bacterium]|nr:hypothetical protein [Chloroflexota bacterium]
MEGIGRKILKILKKPVNWATIAFLILLIVIYGLIYKGLQQEHQIDTSGYPELQQIKVYTTGGSYNRCPIILSHGVACSHRSMMFYANLLQDANYEAITFDGDAVSPDGQKKEILEIIKLIKSRGYIDPWIYLLGHSLGASSSLLAAAECPDVKGVICLGMAPEAEPDYPVPVFLGAGIFDQLHPPGQMLDSYEKLKNSKNSLHQTKLVLSPLSDHGLELMDTFLAAEFLNWLGINTKTHSDHFLKFEITFWWLLFALAYLALKTFQSKTIKLAILALLAMGAGYLCGDYLGTAVVTLIALSLVNYRQRYGIFRKGFLKFTGQILLLLFIIRTTEFIFSLNTVAPLQFWAVPANIIFSIIVYPVYIIQRTVSSFTPFIIAGALAVLIIEFKYPGKLLMWLGRIFSDLFSTLSGQAAEQKNKAKSSWIQVVVLIGLVILAFLGWFRLHREHMVSLQLITGMLWFLFREALIPAAVYILVLRIYYKLKKEPADPGQAPG